MGDHRHPWLGSAARMDFNFFLGYTIQVELTVRDMQLADNITELLMFRGHQVLTSWPEQYFNQYLPPHSMHHVACALRLIMRSSTRTLSAPSCRTTTAIYYR